MENLPNQESREAEISRLIEELAGMEDMKVEEIQSDMVTFAEILDGDPDARGYFEDMEEKIGISADELIEYAKKLSEDPEDQDE